MCVCVCVLCMILDYHCGGMFAKYVFVAENFLSDICFYHVATELLLLCQSFHHVCVKVISLYLDCKCFSHGIPPLQNLLAFHYQLYSSSQSTVL